MYVTYHRRISLIHISHTHAYEHVCATGEFEEMPIFTKMQSLRWRSVGPHRAGAHSRADIRQTINTRETASRQLSAVSPNNDFTVLLHTSLSLSHIHAHTHTTHTHTQFIFAIPGQRVTQQTFTITESLQNSCYGEVYDRHRSVGAERFVRETCHAPLRRIHCIPSLQTRIFRENSFIGNNEIDETK